ncbi:MAG: hypothetical protein H6506_02920 [Calditrichaeota bacterium]|nr:hypothetical protein [Calditrichota bacterium]MCB9391587.1 hypothetical protein [Calditrichota bacterium]
MSSLKQAAILAQLIDQLRCRGSWAGETHIQKACFLMQNLFGGENEYEFVLYHYGPFSFDLRDKLENMLAEGFVTLDHEFGYGPKFRVTDCGKELMEKFPNALSNRSDKIKKTAEFIRNRNAGELERTSTALYLLLENPKTSEDGIADKLVQVKPHVLRDAALDAVKEVKGYM